MAAVWSGAVGVRLGAGYGLHTAALADDGRVVWALRDAQESPTLQAQRVRLAALNAAATVDREIEDDFVPTDGVTIVRALGESSGPDAPMLRIHAAFALGVAERCCVLLGSRQLDDELAVCRQALAEGDPETVPGARAAACELVVRAVITLGSVVGSRSLLADRHL